MLEAAGALDAAATAVADQDLREWMRAAALGLLPPAELTTDRDTIRNTAKLLNDVFDVIADRDLRKRIRAVADEMTEPLPFSTMLWGPAPPGVGAR